MKKLMTLTTAVAMMLTAGFVFAAEPAEKGESAIQMSLPGIVIEDLDNQHENQDSLQTRIESEFDDELSMRLEIQAQNLLCRFESAPEVLASEALNSTDSNS